MPKAVGKCQQCGADMEFWPSQMRKFCSKKCRAVGGMPKKPRTGRFEPCETCGKPVWRRQHQIKEGIGRFCSGACADEFQRRRRVHLACEVCGKPFSLSPSQSKFRPTAVCSRDCDIRRRSADSLGRDHNGRPVALDAAGYVRIYEPAHPHAFKNGWVLEHRWVVEQALDRILETGEHVHHVNGIKHDNRRENLELLSHGAHSRITGLENGRRLAEADATAKKLAEYIARFGPLT